MLRLLVISRVNAYCEGLRKLLEDDNRVASARIAAETPEQLTSIDVKDIDVILYEVANPETARGIRHLASIFKHLQIVAFAVPDCEKTVVACAESGAAGIVSAEASVEEIVTCADAATQGELRCTTRVAGALLRRVADLARPEQNHDPVALLTPREVMLLECIERGMSNKEIARKLGIELSTVKNHVHNILEKLRVQRRGQAAALLHGRRQTSERSGLRAS